MIPFSLSFDPLEGVADMSHLLDAPAGAHGRVRVADGHFATDKGRIRFQAVNMTGPANFPSRRHAERLAARLAGLGVNCVRLHFMDVQKGYGNFRQERQRCLLKDGDDPFSYEIDAEQFDRLDYFAAQLKRRGIYVNVNLHVARLMAYLLPGRSSLKGATWYSRRAIDSQKRWARDFLCHVNPHTGLRWADDPVVALVELNNEDAILCRFYERIRTGKPMPCEEELAAQYGGRLPDAGKLTPDFMRFLFDTERRYVAEMRSFLHDEIGCAAPVTGTQVIYFTTLWPELAADYLDAHLYWCHPGPVNDSWRILDAPMVNHPEESCVAMFSACAAAGMPYTVSEFNTPYPNRYGAEGFLLLSAYGAFQDWDGLFAYSYDNRVDNEPDHVEYFFSLVARTDVLAHFPACASLFLRGDVAVAREVVAVPAGLEHCVGSYADAWRRNPATGPIGCDTREATDGVLPRSLGLHRGVRLAIGAGAATGPASKSLPAEPPCPASRVWVSDTGELAWDVSRDGAGFATVSTENAKVFTGFVRGRTFDLGGVVLKIGPTEGDWATVSLVSHDATGFGGDGRAARILLAATGLARNSGAAFAEAERNEAGEATLQAHGSAWGHGPFLVEAVPADITLPSPASRTVCWALDGGGRRGQSVPVQTGPGGRAVLSIGPSWGTVWYEILVEGQG